MYYCEAKRGLSIKKFLIFLAFSSLFALPVGAQELETQISSDVTQIQLISSASGARTEVKITVQGATAGTLLISVDDLVVYEGGFASAPFGSQPSSLSEFIFVEESEITYQPQASPQEFIVPISIKSGLDQNRFARLLISFQPQDETISQSLLPISVVAVLDENSLPENTLIEPATRIGGIKIRESNDAYKVKRYLPAIPKIIDSEFIEIKSLIDYQGTNLAWAQVAFDYQNSLTTLTPTELPGALLLSGQSQEISYDSNKEKAVNFSNLPKVGLIIIDAYLLDPATGNIISDSKTSQWAIAFPWKIPFLFLVAFLVAFGIWFNFIKPKIQNKSQAIKNQERAHNEAAEIAALQSFDSPLHFLIYSIADASSEKLGRTVSGEILQKYKTPRSLARASKKSLQVIFDPTGNAELKASQTLELVRYLVNNFDGEVPLDSKLLQELPGDISPVQLAFLVKNWKI
jgi:hypothetical protein